MSRILVIQGHPDNSTRHLCHALADAYGEAAEDAGHELRHVDVAALGVPPLRSQAEWQHGELPHGVAAVQESIAWANHLVFFFPLWLGDMPAALKAFLEQVARPGFAFREGEGNPFGRKGLTGRSARVVVTMGMPAIVYRALYRAHSVKSLERNILGFVGIAPVHETLIGNVEGASAATKDRWFATMRQLGAEAG